MKLLTKMATLGMLFLLSGSILAKSVSIRADEWFPINGVPGSSSPGYMIELAQNIKRTWIHS